MELKDLVKIECIKKNVKLSDVADKLGISRQNLYHHLKHENEDIIKKIEDELDLPHGYFKNIDKNCG